MKDMLDRDIVVGDTLAYSSYHAQLGSELKLSKVTAVASFAMQCSPIVPENSVSVPFVVDDGARYVICDWAKGSDAA